MPSILLTPPATEPLSLAEAKAFLRVEHAADDALVASLVESARLHVEMASGRALITQTWRMVRDEWPSSGRLRLRPGPLRDVIAARTYDSAGAAHAFDTQALVPAGDDALAFIAWAAPQPGRAFAGIEIDFEAGYGPAATDVPEPLRQAIRLLVAHWYENRAVATVGHEVAALPHGVAALVAPFRVLSL